jgi:hypothetical protein
MYELRGILLATHLGSPSHPVSTPSLVALSALSDEAGGSLSRNIILNGWNKQAW